MTDADSRPLAVPDGSAVHSDPEIHSGAPVFVGTRVPLRTFLDYIIGGYSIDEFIDHFPSVRPEQPIAFLRQATDALLTQAKGTESSNADLTS